MVEEETGQDRLANVAAFVPEPADDVAVDLVAAVQKQLCHHPLPREQIVEGQGHAHRLLANQRPFLDVGLLFADAAFVGVLPGDAREAGREKLGQLKLVVILVWLGTGPDSVDVARSLRVS